MITINVKSALIYLLFIALIILVIYLTLLAKNLIKTIKETNKILADTSSHIWDCGRQGDTS